MIENVRIDSIIPHPNNPRKDLGDISDLAQSIKANGILQNLTVVPTTVSEEVSAQGGKTATERRKGYMAVIGHRRLAAAKMAGFTHVPCAVVEMDEETQIATMLIENIERASLTTYEEAKGIQMLLDFGNSVNDIAEKTGFSKSKVYSRKKLLELDDAVFKEADSRNVSLADFAELDKISALDLKNKAAEALGTANFQWELNNAIRAEKGREKRVKLLEWLNSFATEIANDDDIPETLRIVKWLYEDSRHDMPEDASADYYFHDDGKNIKLMKYVQPEEKAEQEQGKSEADLRRENLGELSRQAFEMRTMFIKGFSSSKAKKAIAEIMAFALKTMITPNYINFNENLFADLLGIEIAAGTANTNENVLDWQTDQQERFLLLTAYSMGADNANWKYYNGRLEYEPNAKLDSIYKSLCALGYEMSDEERALRDGTHELFLQGV